MFIKVLFLILFFAVMIGVGLYSRKHASNVNDFVLGGQNKRMNGYSLIAI